MSCNGISNNSDDGPFPFCCASKPACTMPRPWNRGMEMESANYLVVKHNCVWHRLWERPVGYWISSFPILHLCIINIQGQFWCFILFTIELKSALAALIASAMLSCMRVLWKSPSTAFVMQEASKFTSHLSRNSSLLIVWSFVTLSPQLNVIKM